MPVIYDKGCSGAETLMAKGVKKPSTAVKVPKAAQSEFLAAGQRAAQRAPSAKNSTYGGASAPVLYGKGAK